MSFSSVLDSIYSRTLTYFKRLRYAVNFSMWRYRCTFGYPLEVEPTHDIFGKKYTLTRAIKTRFKVIYYGLCHGWWYSKTKTQPFGSNP